MEKIPFENFPSTKTPIDATNLNQLQTNTENAIQDSADELNNSIEELANLVGEGGVESSLLGTNGYIRFENGFQIAWLSKQVTAGGTQWGNIYYSDHDLGKWAKPFAVCYTTSPYSNSSQYWATVSGSGNANAGSVRCFRPNNSTSNVWVGAIGFGKWK